MLRLTYSDEPSTLQLRSIREIVAGGGVLAYPTDTIYGLGGDFYSLAVHERIDRLKNRSLTPYSAAVSDLTMLRSLVAPLPPGWERWLNEVFPGPYTILLKPSPEVDPRLLKNGAKIAVRIPALTGLLRMIEACRTPWVSTSVNLSGGSPLSAPDEIERRFPEIDLLIDAGSRPQGMASTVVDITVDPPRIVRPGSGMEKLRQLFPGLRA